MTTHGYYDHFPKRKRLYGLNSGIRNFSRSPYNDRGIINPYYSTNHDAEHAQIIIQGVLNQYDSINRERQVIWKSTSDFVNSMTHNKTSADDFSSLDVFSLIMILIVHLNLLLPRPN